MQYFFDIRQNGDLAQDNDAEGAEFPDALAAREEAVSSIREILAESLRAGVESRDGEMIVKDEYGETVLIVPFSMRVRLG